MITAHAYMQKNVKKKKINKKGKEAGKNPVFTSILMGPCAQAVNSCSMFMTAMDMPYLAVGVL